MSVCGDNCRKIAGRVVRAAMLIALLCSMPADERAAHAQATPPAQTPAELTAQGDAALAKNDEDAALTAYMAALQADPKHVGAKRGRAEIALRRGLYPQAISGMTDVITAEPTVAEHYARRAAAFAGDGQFAPAIADWTKAIELDAAKPAYLVGRGDAHLGLKNTDAAITDFVAAVREFRDYLPGYLRLADTHLRVKKDLSRAVDVFNQALGVDPKSVEALFGRGDAYLQDEQYTAAMKDLTRAIELDPDHARARSLRGDVELVQGNYTEALADYRKAVEAAPSQAIFHCDLGVALVRTDDFAGAIKSLARAVRLDPNMSRAFVYLAVAEFSQGNQIESQSALEEAKRLDPKWKDAKLERRNTRYIGFANGSDKPVEVSVWYYTDAVDGKLGWFPTEPGEGEPIVHKIKARDTLYPAYQGKRLPVSKLRFTVRAEDDSFTIDRFQTSDLKTAPAEGYVDTAPQTFSFPIVAPEK